MRLKMMIWKWDISQQKITNMVYDDVVGDDDDDVGAIKKPNRLKLVPRGESEPS